MAFLTQLYSRNKVQAINRNAIPLLTYSFGLVKWSATDLEDLSRLVRTQLTKHRMKHPKSTIERVTLPILMGGIGITDIPRLHSKQINDLRCYFHEKQTDNRMFDVICKADVKATPLHLSEATTFTPKSTSIEDQKKNWKQKELHGTFPNQLDKDNIDKDATSLWLKNGNLFGETTGFMMAIQDRVIATRNYRKYIIKEAISDDKCRKCHETAETIEHITGSCRTLANTEYTKRHNNVAKIIHQNLAGGTASASPYYKYEPSPVVDNSDFKLYWDREIRTDLTIPANRPDITLLDKMKQEVHLIDIAIPLSHNIDNSYSNKISKYKDLADEVKKMWKVKKVYIRPIIISATGLIPTSTKKHLKILQLESYLSKIQKSVILDTCHIVRKFLGDEID